MMPDGEGDYLQAIYELERETRCTVSIVPRRDGARLLFIDSPDEKPLLKAECYDGRMIKFVIGAITQAYKGVEPCRK